MPEVVHWNPKRWGRLGQTGPARWVPAHRGFNNFGDLLGPLIVDRVRGRLDLGRAANRHRLLAVGSIMRLANPGDTIWGAGINGKSVDQTTFPKLDVRAVRGPRTAEVLTRFGNDVPDVYGDPALLIPHLWSDEELGIMRRTGGTVLMPNYNDIRDWPSHALDPRGDPLERVRVLASADRVIASSLHAIVIAEAYGVPSVLVASSKETPFKYADYYEGTDRSLPSAARSWESAMDAEAAPPIQSWDAEKLIAAFPRELWKPRRNAR